MGGRTRGFCASPTEARPSDATRPLSASQKTSSTQPPHPSIGDPSLGPEGQAERKEDNLPPPQSKKHPSQVKKLPKIPSNTEVLPKLAVKTDCRSSVSTHTKDTSPGRAGQGAPAPPLWLAGSRPPQLASKSQKTPQGQFKPEMTQLLDDFRRYVLVPQVNTSQSFSVFHQ